jgi:hypothetical protein
MKNLKEYSKKCIAAMILLWFIVAFFTIGVIVYELIFAPEYLSIDGLLGYVGLPMTGGIVGYLIKSAMENKEKIKGSINSNEDILSQVYEEKEEGENDD